HRSKEQGWLIPSFDYWKSSDHKGPLELCPLEGYADGHSGPFRQKCRRRPAILQGTWWR
ncbi:hypothetical protein RRG08_041340, partial [Elysia crispata]